MKIKFPNFFIIFFVFLSVLSIVNGECDFCPDGCTCTKDDLTCSVNCTSVGLSDVPIFSEVQYNVTKLFLNNNQISKISLSSFQNLSGLITLHLQDNLINEIEDGAFINLLSLTELNLNNNQLTTIPDDIFYLQLHDVFLLRNNWSCNCDSARFQNWIQSHPSIVHNSSDVLCAQPTHFRNASIDSNTVDLSHCAEGWVSCSEREGVFVLWDSLSDSPTSVNNVTSCMSSCFADGRHYSLLYNDTLCFCADQQSTGGYLPTESEQWQACQLACSHTDDEFSCNRKIARGSVLEAAPSLQFDGIRTYRRSEEVDIKVEDSNGIAESYMWNFNDTTPYRKRYETTITHKYAVPLTYGVTVIASRGKGVKTESFPLDVEEEIAGLDLQCPLHTNSGQVEATYSLKKGTNPEIKWRKDDEATYLHTGILTEPQHYVTGSTAFNAVSQPLINMEAQDRASSNYEPSADGKKFILLFPGMWIVENGTLHSWELVVKSTQKTIRLQIYRPTCSNPDQLLLPGCQVSGVQTPFSTCSVQDCSVGQEECPSGTQYCYFNSTESHCKTPLSPCSLSKNSNATRHAGSVPVYEFVKEFYVAFDGRAPGLYQLQVNEEVDIQVDDVIAVAFEKDSIESDSPSLSDLPLACMLSSNSRWKQSAMLFALNTSEPTNLDTSQHPNQWLDEVWCDVRVHYSKKSAGSVTFPLATNATGEYTYVVTVSNQVSNLSQDCLVIVEENVLRINIIDSSIVDGIPTVYVAKNTPTNISLEIITFRGQETVQLELSSPDRESLDQDQEYKADCDVIGSSTCSKFVNTSLTIDEPGNTTISILAKTAGLRTTTSLKLITEEAITDAQVLPRNINRIVVGTYQEFTFITATGTNITSSWVVDGLQQFKYTRPSFDIMFRTPLTYEITTSLANHVSGKDISTTLAVDDINRLTNLQFIGDKIVENNQNLSFSIQVDVDENMDVTVDWYIDSSSVTESHQHSQPHSGTRPAGSVEQVTINDTLYHTFTSSGNKTIRVIVSNDYDTIETPEDNIIEVRQRLTGVELEPIDSLVTGADIEFQINALPSGQGCVYTIDWGDSSIDMDVSTSSVSHMFHNLGPYTVIITADNAISNVTSSTNITIYDQIQGLSVQTDGPTELGYNTSIIASLVTGNDSHVRYTFDMGNDDVIVNSSDWTLTYNYTAVGQYNITVTASNPADSVSQSLKVNVFELEIVNVKSLAQCYEAMTAAYIQAIMPVESLHLFGFNWTFGDGSSSEVIEGNNNVTHVYDTALHHNGQLLAYSLLSGKSDIKIFTVCVQTAITNVSFSSQHPHVRTNQTLAFDYDVIGGTEVSATLDFGDGQMEDSSGSSGTLDHAYTAAGNYTALISAFNLVSHENYSIQVIVQEPISISTVSTSSGYGYNVPVGESIAYTVSYTGSDPSFIEWDFGTGDVRYDGASGETVNNTYPGPDNVKISVNVVNLVSNNIYNVTVGVYSPVGNITFTSLPSIVTVGASVWLNVSASGFEKLYWKITPNSSTDEWDHISDKPATSYLHTFTQTGLFNVTVKSENEASAEYISTKILVAEAITNRLSLSAYNCTSSSGGNYGAVGDESVFEVLLDNGLGVSTTTSEDTSYLTFAWEVSKNETVVYATSDSSVITYQFLDLGEYRVWINVSNTISDDVQEYVVTIIERIENVTLVKLDPPTNAVATNDAARINATVEYGTELSYQWYSGSTTDDTEISRLFTRTYTVADTYNITVVVSNPLGSESAYFELKVQDRVEGLTIEHKDAIVPFYVALNAYTYFRADVTTGTDVNFTWKFVDSDTSVASDPHSTEMNEYRWNFTTIAAYNLMLDASNLVSSKPLNRSVEVLDPAVNLTLQILPRKFIQSKSNVTIKATVNTDSGAFFSFDFGDGSDRVNTTVLSTSFEALHNYDVDGTYDVIMYAFNNASRVNVTEVIYVREYIDGVDIGGCNANDYLRSDLIYNLTANITSGTAVQYDWTITYSDGQVNTSAGSQWSVRMQIVGETTITLRAHNEVHERFANITITIQDPPDVKVMLVNRGTIYINQTVEIAILYNSGTDLMFDVDFDDGNVIRNATGFNYSNVYIDPGVYIVSVTTYNKVDSIVTPIRLPINELACVQPRLSLVGSGVAQTKFYRSRQVLLETEIETFGCTAYVLSYRWHFYLQDSCANLDDANRVSLPLSTAYSPLLSLPPLTLGVGKYCATNTASYVGTSLFNTISTTLEVISSPLAVIIAGGTQRLISQTTDIILDASSSFDPDLAANQQTDLTYHWTCTSRPRNVTDGILAGLSEGTDDKCFDFKKGETVWVVAGKLLPQFEYNFTVTANTTGKEEGSAWQSIIIVPSEIPTATITCHSCRQQSSLKISSAYHLTLKGSCESCRKGEVSYLWEATRRNSTDQTPIPFPLNQETTTTGNDNRYLVVRVSALLFSFYEYEFQLTVTAQNAIGVSKLILYANKPPEGGNCTMTYQGSQVYVLETPVDFKCMGWVDEDISPLIYTIVAKRYNQNVQVDDFLIYKGTSSQYQAYLPVGFEDNQYDIIIQILVEDQLGTYSVGLNETLNVKLNNNVNTIEWLRNKTSVELAELQKSSNPQVVADFAAGLITVLNQDSEAHSTSTDDQEFQSRKEIRSNITQSVTSLSTSTFAEIQQVAAVFKQCMKVPAELQDEVIHNISMAKLEELTQQMPNYVSVATQTSFLAVTNDLVGIVSFLVDSLNYQVYFGGSSSEADSTVNPTLSEVYRRERVDTLIESAVQLTDNVLEGRVEGEEPVFLNASAFSSIGGRTTPATMNSSIFNDGCVMELPATIFSNANLSADAEIFYIFFVSQQNPYTFGYAPSALDDRGIANITTRVPSLQFKYPNHTILVVNNLRPSLSEFNTSGVKPIKMVMAPSMRVFIEHDDTGDLAELSESNAYLPRSSVHFDEFVVTSLNSVAVKVRNNNTDPDVAVHIMIVFDRVVTSDREENRPFLDVYFGDVARPNELQFIKYMRLTEGVVALQADHRNYTVFIDPRTSSTILPEYYLNISSYFEFHDVVVGVGVYYSTCQFFDTENNVWSSVGLSTSEETLPSAAVCYSEHLTSFGSFVINPPNVVDITDIVNIDFTQNSIALILVVVVFVIFLLGALRSYQLDKRDIDSVSVIPLCGPNQSFKYEITVKTSPGIGSGTTANVGICVYGYESRSGSRHLFKEDAFQRGAVDVFQIATDVSLGTIYKLKIWHDNTGLDPGWNVSRVMVKDLQTEAKYYFLIDAWLQVYPDDVNETCLQKTVRAASDEEMSDFSTRFGTQLSYGWEDAHLWLSLIERPPRSSFTRLQRATCCVTLIYMFILFSAMWYQSEDDRQEFGVQLAKDIAVGAIVSFMVFPINILIVFLFKKSKVKITPTTSWVQNRAQTAQTVEILDEVLDGRSRKSTVSRMFSFSHFGLSEPTSSIRQHNMKNAEEMYELSSSQLSNQYTSEDTGISTGVPSTPSNDSGIRLRRRNTSYPRKFEEEDGDGYSEFWDSFASETSLREEDLKSTRPTNLRRTQKAKFQQNVMMTSEEDIKEEDEEIFDDIDDNNDGISTVSAMQHQRTLHTPESTLDEPVVMSVPSRRPSLPNSSPMYLAYFLCITGSAVSIFFIILYGHTFGVDVTKRWAVSMVIALLESLFIIEPMKVLFLAIYIAMFTEQPTPEQKDSIVDEPLLQIDDDCCRDGGVIQKPGKIRPPGGFALEQCKQQAKKSARAKKYILHFGIHTVFFWCVFAFCMWDRDFLSYYNTRSLHQATLEPPISRSGTNNITFNEIKTDADMWAWLNDVFEPNVMNKDTSSFYDNSNNFNYLLGQVRIRQQRSLPAERCPAYSSPSWPNLAPEFSCVSGSFQQDTESYYPGWSSVFNGNNSLWIHSPRSLNGYGYWGKYRIYDDSGYIVYLDETTSSSQLTTLQEQGWTDRLSRVLFVEFTQYNPATYWFTVSVFMFEFEPTGVVHPSHITQTVRLFSPSSGFYIDQLFIIFIAFICTFLWTHEIIKLYRSRKTFHELWRAFNCMNMLIVLLTTTVCVLFIYKEAYLEEVIRNYKVNRNIFHNFYAVAFIANTLTYLAGILLALLIVKSVKIFRFFRCLSIYEETLSRAFRQLLSATLMLAVLVLAYAQLGYLVYGLNSAHVVPNFQDFHNSLYSMIRIFNRNLTFKPCFDAMPVFTIIFFLSYYLGIFLIFCRLFAAIIIKEYKFTCMTLSRNKPFTTEYDVMQYMIQRLKLRLGLAKPKQYRATVHFEGMSNHSSESSFISLDSLGSCFTPERISQCSDASGISTCDSGMGSPSDHSISLFDYLTLEHPPFDKPMDDLHLDYLYDRLSTYSVDMMLHKVDRVNKLGGDVLSIESKLLEVSQKLEQKKVLQKESSDIAFAASSTSVFDSKPGSSSKSLSSASQRDGTNSARFPMMIGGNIDSLLEKPTKRSRTRPPVRSSSYVDPSRFSTGIKNTHARSMNSSDMKKRPHSDEGSRAVESSNTSAMKEVIKKKPAW